MGLTVWLVVGDATVVVVVLALCPATHSRYATRLWFKPAIPLSRWLRNILLSARRSHYESFDLFEPIRPSLWAFAARCASGRAYRQGLVKQDGHWPPALFGAHRSAVRHRRGALARPRRHHCSRRVDRWRQFGGVARCLVAAAPARVPCAQFGSRSVDEWLARHVEIETTWSQNQDPPWNGASSTRSSDDGMSVTKSDAEDLGAPTGSLPRRSPARQER